MPAKHTQKYYVANGYYHIYNAGIDNRTIFQDEQDYTTFLGYLEEYLTPKDTKALTEKLATASSSKEKLKLSNTMRMNNFADEITMLAYVLMPDHFHLFVKQKSKDSLNQFMNSIMTRYVMYFNRKYQRRGPLFQGVYKAVLIEHEDYFAPLSGYIHKNPLSIHSEPTKQPSSYPEYVGTRSTVWVHPEEIMEQFSKTNPSVSYISYVSDTTDFTLISEEIIDTHTWTPTQSKQQDSTPQPKKDGKKGFLHSIFGR